MLPLAAGTAVSLGREATIIAWTGKSAKSGEIMVVVGHQFEIQAGLTVSGQCLHGKEEKGQAYQTR